MIQLKSRDDILRIKESGLILAETMGYLKELVREGIETREIDREAQTLIERRGAVPSFLGYLDFPGSVCISVNEQVIHGIPGSRKLKAGDLVKLDLGVELKGYYSDAAWTFSVGETSTSRARLMKVTRHCLEAAVAVMGKGARVQDIGRTVSDLAATEGYGVVRQYCGHGVGFSQHEDPQIPNYVGRGLNPRLKNGMVLCVEPMINQGTWEVDVLDDGWTVVTVDGSDSAHYEYTIAIVGDAAVVLTPLGDL